MNPLKIIKNGIIDENPTFSQVIGMCPTDADVIERLNSRSWYGFIYNSSSYLLKYCYFFN